MAPARSEREETADDGNVISVGVGGIMGGMHGVRVRRRLLLLLRFFAHCDTARGFSFFPDGDTQSATKPRRLKTRFLGVFRSDSFFLRDCGLLSMGF